MANVTNLVCHVKHFFKLMLKYVMLKHELKRFLFFLICYLLANPIVSSTSCQNIVIKGRELKISHKI